MEYAYYFGFILTGLLVAGIVLWLAWSLRNDRAKSKSIIVIKMNGDYELVIDNDGAKKTVTRRLTSMQRTMESDGLDMITMTFVNDEIWEAGKLLA